MRDESRRNEVCDKFQKYFYDSINKDKNTAMYCILQGLIEIAKTQDIELACFCQSPHNKIKKRCHTETIKKYIKEQLTMFYQSEYQSEVKL